VTDSAIWESDFNWRKVRRPDAKTIRGIGSPPNPVRQNGSSSSLSSFRSQSVLPSVKKTTSAGAGSSIQQLGQ
jgi:hypothetical protein